MAHDLHIKNCLQGTFPSLLLLSQKLHVPFSPQQVTLPSLLRDPEIFFPWIGKMDSTAFFSHLHSWFSGHPFFYLFSLTKAVSKPKFNGTEKERKRVTHAAFTSLEHPYSCIGGLLVLLMETTFWTAEAFVQVL